MTATHHDGFCIWDIHDPAYGSYTAGWSNGNQWTVPEADSKITSGWFWGNNKKTPATMEDRANRYFVSVGYNSVMLLNVPPNNQGSVDEQILSRVVEFGEAVSGISASNKAADAVIWASQVRGNDIAYSPANLLDGDPLIYWTVEDDTTSGSVLIDLGKTTTFDVVSIEEAIEFGQRITSFRVEYSNDATNWSTMKEGTTVGAKRLVRSAPVKARYVKITVATDTSAYTYTGANTAAKGSVPMLAEVGIYKAAEGFALGSGAPDGMEVIDERDSEFAFSGYWNNESGPQFPIEQTGKWCNSGASFTVNFTGSKNYLVGTVDPSHGTANVTVDGKTTQINTRGSARALGQIIYTSDDLEHGEHTLTLNATGTIGIDGAYVINNGGVGMIGIENAKYTMNEDETMEVKLVRVGGTTGEATVLVSPNPGSAVQGDYDTELIQEFTFADGEKEKTALVRTKRNTNTTGDTDEPRTEPYTADDRFQFPASGETTTLEIELTELHNDPSENLRFSSVAQDDSAFACSSCRSCCVNPISIYQNMRIGLMRQGKGKSSGLTRESAICIMKTSVKTRFY